MQFSVINLVRHKLQNLSELASSAKQYIDARTEYSQRQITAYGIIFSINYPLYYIIWLIATPESYENLSLRIIASALCVPLIFHRQWPDKLRSYLSIYWYLSTIYCLPFFFTFMTLENNASTSWLLNSSLIVFLAFLIFDLWSMLFILSAGISSAILFFSVVSHSPFSFQPGTIDFNSAVATMFAAFVIGGIFNRNREIIEKERFQTMQAIGASMAHELRTPLRTISSGLNAIGKQLPQLIEAYELARAENLAVPYISTTHYKALPEVFTNLASETQAAFSVIDMLLVKTSIANINQEQFTSCSIVECVEQALKRYAFDLGEKELVNWDPSQDFAFKGDELLMIHTLFNLFKNAFFYIKAAGKGEIYIWCSTSGRYNQLHFKDTGAGINGKILQNIFDRFFTKTPHGSGVGLAFCRMVMESFHGLIECYSEEMVYTEFVLSFPKYTQADAAKLMPEEEKA